MCDFFSANRSGTFINSIAVGQNGFEAPLKQMPNAPVAAVGGLVVHTVELTHTLGQIAIRGLDSTLPVDNLAKANIDEADRLDACLVHYF